MPQNFNFLVSSTIAGKLMCIGALFIISGCQTMSQNKSASLDSMTAPVEQDNQPVIAVIMPDQAERESRVQIIDNELANQSDLVKAVQAQNIWYRIAEGLKIQVPQNKRVRSQRNWYAKHQKYLDRVIDRAQPFLYFIVEEIEARNMPMELALLPIVESAFDPFAYSHGRASGMWQFIPGTAKRFGMEQNWWYDGRRDVYASTIGALDYLEYLHKHFKGNWLHALAAYNSGEGNVGRAIRNNKRKGKPTDFWNLKLPKETKAYVPKLLALSDLLKRDAEFALNWKPIADREAIRKVDIGSQLDLALAAELSGLTVEQIYRLNPGFNRWSTPPKGPHYLLLPIDKSDAFLEKLAATPKSDRVRWQRYTIRNGDSLSTIARKHNTTVATIRSVNKIRGTSIRAGDTLLIPTASQSRYNYTLSSDRRLSSKQNTKRSGTKITHVVQSGDNFWDLSRKYGVHHRTLAKWNGMAPTDPLRIGKKLVIWTKQEPAIADKTKSVALSQSQKVRKVNYRVRRGDSLARISDKFSVSLGDLKRWNKQLAQRKYLQPGDRITMYVDIRNQSGD